MDGRLGSLRFAIFCTSILTISSLAEACGGGGGSSSSQILTTKQIITACTPAPLPTPGAMLISPAANASGVSTTIRTVQFSIYTNSGSGATTATVSSVTLVPTPSGPSIWATQALGQITPSPSGSTVFNATFTVALAASTIYNVTVSGVEPGSCYAQYTTSAGSFTTGS
jgi:hypothetical protein